MHDVRTISIETEVNEEKCMMTTQTMCVFPPIKWLQAMVINISVNSFVVAQTSFGWFSFSKTKSQPQCWAFGSIEKTINFGIYDQIDISMGSISSCRSNIFGDFPCID